MGWWCQSEGLIADESRYIQPTPDPVKVAIAADPAVQLADADLDACQAEFDKLDGSFLRLLTSRRDLGGGGFSMATGFRRGRESGRKLQQWEREILAAEEARDDAGDRLVKARQHAHNLRDAIRQRMTLPEYVEPDD